MIVPMISKKKFRAEAVRFITNFWPCIRGAGGRMTYLSEDFTKLQITLPLNWRTRNRVGTIYGGSLYASTDPFYMLMLMELLGKNYVVWDKGCSIRFKRPAKVTLYADFHVTREMLQEVKDRVAKENEITFTWKLEYKDKEGTVYTEFDKVLYVATKSHYQAKLKARMEKS